MTTLQSLAKGQPTTARSLALGQAKNIQKINPILPLDGGRPIWTRQPEESNREWAWFLLYRGLPPATRSVARAYQTYKKARGEKKGGHTTPDHIRAMYRNWSWQKRALEHDAYCDLEFHTEIEQQRKASIQATAALGMRMRQLAAVAVDAIFQDVYHEHTDPVTGEVTVTLKNTISAAAMVRIAKAGVELERLALGLDPGAARGAGSVRISVAVAQHVRDGGAIMGTDEAMIQEAQEILRARKLQATLVGNQYVVTQEDLQGIDHPLVEVVEVVAPTGPAPKRPVELVAPRE